MKRTLKSLGDAIDRNFGSLRKSVDITPWSKEGHSFLGLKRKEAKWLGIFLIGAGLFILDPPGGLLPINDLFNMILSKFLSTYFNVFSMEIWLVLTYVLIGPLLVVAGAFVYPANTGNMLGSIFMRVRKFVKNIFKKPAYLLITLVIFYFMYKWVKGGLL